MIDGLWTKSYLPEATNEQVLAAYDYLLKPFMDKGRVPDGGYRQCRRKYAESGRNQREIPQRTHSHRG